MRSFIALLLVTFAAGCSSSSVPAVTPTTNAAVTDGPREEVEVEIVEHEAKAAPKNDAPQAMPAPNKEQRTDHVHAASE